MTDDQPKTMDTNKDDFQNCKILKATIEELQLELQQERILRENIRDDAEQERQRTVRAILQKIPGLKIFLFYFRFFALQNFL